MTTHLEAGHNEFVGVTELAGADVTREQIQRLCNRYYWAANYCRGKDVLEVACGTGPGLGYLSSVAKSLSAGDISESILEQTRAHYGRRFELKRMDAQELPYPENSKDVILIFEAIYYLPLVDKFLLECRRVLREGGVLLIVTANKDLCDFNPSSFSHEYYGVKELTDLLEQHGFSPSFYGDCPLESISFREKILQPVKKLAVQWNLMPKTMKGKRFLKRFVFGKLATMPAEITEGMGVYQKTTPLPPGKPDCEHKVIFCAATMRPEN